MPEIKKKKHTCSVIILAAGKSGRMGSHKFALKFDDKITFLEKIIQQYKNFGCRDIVVVLNEKGVAFLQKNLPEISNTISIATNTHLEWERFYSIKLGIQSLKHSNRVFIHNVDNPFVNFDVLKDLQANLNDTDFVVPVFGGRGGHPILLSENVINNLISEKHNDLILSSFLQKFIKKIIGVDDGKILVNINTKEDYQINIGGD